MHTVGSHRKNHDEGDEIEAARSQFKRDRERGLDSLNRIFRNGRPPGPALDGPYAGELVALDIAPGVSRLLELVTRYWMPWRGKYFISAEQRGDNLFTRSSRAFLRLLFPFYRGVIDDPPARCRAFTFRTYVAAGRVDPDRQVLKIDYDNDTNPALSIRRILDEVVQVEDGVYLGKVHFKWWWGEWQRVAYFSLRPQGGGREAGGGAP